jgi:carbonic anhydrase
LPRFDDGLAQSPINILSDSTQKDNNKELNVRFYIEIDAAENLGHTIQIDFKEGSTSMAEGKTYQAKQFHFHTPSEHLIDGMTFPMEMHIVSVLKDSNAAKSPNYLVIGLLFRMGHENKFINEFLKSIPPEEHHKEILEPGKVVLEDLFNNIPKNELGSYYTYKGSLTTPPFTESVDWIVRKYILEASPEQIAAIEKMEGNNARHVQASYGRKVYSN